MGTTDVQCFRKSSFGHLYKNTICIELETYTWKKESRNRKISSFYACIFCEWDQINHLEEF